MSSCAFPIGHHPCTPASPLAPTLTQVCLVGKKGNDPPGMAAGGVGSDVIFSERRGQSQKPEEIYQLIEELVPRGEEEEPPAWPPSFSHTPHR